MTDILETNNEEILSELVTYAAKVEEPKKGKYFRTRQTNPDKYKEFRTIEIDKNKGIFAVLGIFEEDGKRKSEVQSYLFDKDSWTKEEVNSWLKKHKNKSKAEMFDEDKSIFIPFQAEILNKIEHSEALDNALAAKKIGKDKDLMYIKFRYVHEGSNSNNDVFDADELEERHTTAIYKPLNLKHKENKIIGSIYDTEFIPKDKSNNGKAAVNIYTVIYKWLFPKEADEIKKDYTEGKLNVSMETWFDHAECSVCGSKFEHEIDYCSHLKSRYTVADNKRLLHGITFGGAGIVDDPADEDAKALSLGKKVDAGMLKDRMARREEIRKFESMINEATNVFYDAMWSVANPGDTKEDVTKERIKKFNELVKDIKEILDNINFKKIAKGDKLMADFDVKELVDALVEKAKADNKEAFEIQLKEELTKVKTEGQTELDKINKELADIKADKEKLEKEFNDYKAGIEKDKLLASRKDILAKANVILEGEEKDINDAVLSMTDKTFDLFVKAKKVEAKEPNKPESKADEKPEDAKANLKVNDNDVNKENKDNLFDILNKL